MKSWEKLWEELKKKKLQGNVMWRALNISDQAGGVSRAVRYKEYYKGTDKEDGFAVELKIGLADLQAQVLMLAILNGISYSELMELAYSRVEYAIQKRLPY